MNAGKQCLKCGYTRTDQDPSPFYPCPSCGAVYEKVEAARRAKNQKPTKKNILAKVGQVAAAIKIAPELGQQEVRKSLSTLVRTYHGKQSDAVTAFSKETAKLKSEGFYPTQQLWEDGRWSGWAFLVALLLCFVVIGFPIILYMIIVKPDGVLTVTYERESP